MIEYRVNKRLHTLGGAEPMMSMWPSLADPSYWMVFDGSNDYVTLPSGEGSEPTTALFVEAWIRRIGKTTQNMIVCRGSFYEQGYSFEVSRAANGAVTMRLSLRSLNSSSTAAGTALFGDDLPIHVAAGWDGSTIYYFVNGALLATKAVSGTITYNGTQWLLGQMPGALWLLDADVSMVRVSNVCRHTTSFSPPTTFASDANTVGLFMATEGTGTALADTGPGAHHGTFLGSGEPAWGDEVDLSTLSHGEAIWSACLAAVPAVTGGSVYLKRVDANLYYLYRKVHATGPYWARFTIRRAGSSAFLNLNAVHTGTPTPANDIPPNWTVEPATLLQSGSATEYVLYGTMEGGSPIQWGNTHGYEILDSEGWTVDGSPVSLSDGQYASGSEIKYTVMGHVDDGATTFVEITKTLTLNTTDMWLAGHYQFDWLENWTPHVDNYVLMGEYNSTALDTLTFVPGGTDYALNASATGIRAHAAAGWKSSNEAIMAYYIDLADGLRYGTTSGTEIVGVTSKLYFRRTKELNAALAGSSWSWNSRYLALDGAGNHFLKTT